MTNEELKKEFSRWVDNDKGKVWYRNEYWTFVTPMWNNTGHYITNDKHAELRRLAIDEPDTEFEFTNEHMNKWIDADGAYFSEQNEYRVKKVEPVYEYQWVIYLESIKEYVFSDFVVSKEELDIAPTAKVVERYEESKRIKNV